MTLNIDKLDAAVSASSGLAQRLFRVYADAEWNESDHPRGADGRFGSGGVSESGASEIPVYMASEIKSRYASRDFKTQKSWGTIKTKVDGKTQELAPLDVLSNEPIYLNKRNELVEVTESGARVIPKSEEDKVKTRLAEITNSARQSIAEYSHRFAKPARELARKIHDEFGVSVQIVHPEDSSSRYLYIENKNNKPIKIRIADHPQPMEGNKVVGGYSTSEKKRHEASDLSIDPETKLTPEDAMRYLKSELNK